MSSINKPIAKLFSSLFLFATAVGMNFVIFPVLLLENGADPFKIGLSSAFEIIGGIVMSFFLGSFLKKILLRNILATVAISYSIAVALIFFVKNFYLWLLIIFIIGMCWVAYVFGFG